MEYNDYEGYGTRDPGTPPGGKKNFEEKLDEIADEVSKTVSEGVKRLEETVSSIKERPEISESKIRTFFTSPMGGLVVLIIGVLWFFNAVGLFDNKVLPVILIAVGIYMIFKFKSDHPGR
jgi:uncharacterized membrane protein